MKNFSKPNFIVLGAPKCGTTSMFYYLSQHNDICLPPLKEQHYFATDIPYPSQPTKKEYYDMFSNCHPERLIGDVATFYMYSNDAIRNILNEIENPKVICMVRNPFDALASYHSQMVWTLNEDEISLKVALKKEVIRRKGKELPRNLHYHPKMIYYSQIFKFGEQLNRILSLVGSPNIHVVFADDLKRDPHSAMNRVWDFLQIPNADYIDYSNQNTRKIVRNKSLQLLMFDKGSTFRKLASSLIKNRFVKNKLIDLVRRMNSRSVKAPLLYIDQFEDSLIIDLNKDITLLEKLTQKKLDHWYLHRAYLSN